MEYKIEITDGGRLVNGYTGEKKDCCVRAFSLAFDSDYKDTYKILEKYGRKKNHGINARVFLEQKMSEKLFGKKCIKIPCKLTLQKTLESIGSGVFLFRMSGHILCIRNGIALDTFKPGGRCRCIDLWKVVV